MSLTKRIKEWSPSAEKEIYTNLIQEINEGDFSMSFTSIKEFSDSPLSFLRYKTKEKVTTDAMEFGTLLHLLVLEPHLFSEEYIILKKAVPGRSWTLTANKEHKQAEEARAVEEGKKLTTEENVLAALELKEAVLSNSVAGDLIRGCTKFEFGIKFKYKGFTWNGFIDGKSRAYKIDLKKVPDARKHKIRWLSRERKLHWQAYLYNIGSGKNPYADYYNILVDGEGRVSVLKQDQYSLQLAKAELDEILIKFEQCTLMESWYQSLEYWTEEGYLINSEL